MPPKAFVPCSIINSKAVNLICPSLTFSNYLSQPILALSKTKLLAAFLIGRGEILGAQNGYRIWPPKLMAIFNVYDGQFEELRAVTPASFSLQDDPEKPIHGGVSPPEKADAEFLSMQIKLFQSFDNLVASLERRGVYQGEMQTYDKNFQQLCERPLIPYYYKLFLKRIVGI